MLVEGRIWDLFVVPQEPPICGYESAGRWFIEGDTLLDGMVYKKLYYNPIKSNPPAPFCGGFYVDTTKTYLGYGFYREDTLTRRVYMWRENEAPHESLLYDFSLQVGDTLHYPFNSYPVINVTDWILDNGEHRKAFEFEGLFANFYVEEIGYLIGQFGQVYSPFEGLTQTACVRDGEEILYSETLNGKSGCIFATSSTQVPEFQGAKISPNPFQDHLILTIAEDQQGTFFVFELKDMTGRVVFRETLEPGFATGQISLPPLPQGMYVWAMDGRLQGKLAKM